MANSDKGFASMDPERVKQIAKLGGKAAWKKGTAYRWTSEAAQIAGRKGGIAGQQARAARKAHEAGQ